MKRIAFVAMASFFFAQSAIAASTWSVISFTTTPQNAPAVLGAADRLMQSAAGKDFPGRLHLQVNLADGANPATHSFVPIYKTTKQREEFVRKLQADPAWGEFMATMVAMTQPVSTTLHRTLKSWGKIDDNDHVWMAHAFSVRDPAGFLAAIDQLMASPTGKKFPGQVYLSAVVAGGLSPVTHVISVGYASEAEMDAWQDTRNASADWAAYLEASRSTGDYLGGSLARDIKTWGPASLKDLAPN